MGSAGAASRFTRLHRPAAAVPRLGRLRQAIPRGRLRPMGPGDAGRRDRRGTLARRAGVRRRRPHVHLRRQLRRLCRVVGARQDAASLQVRHQSCRCQRPQGADDRQHGRQRLQVIERDPAALDRRPEAAGPRHRVAAEQCRGHRSAAAHRARRSRSAGTDRPEPRHGQRHAQAGQGRHVAAPPGRRAQPRHREDQRALFDATFDLLGRTIGSGIAAPASSASAAPR